MTFRLLKEIANPEFWQTLRQDPKLRENFSREINQTVKEASYALPTARETEALPFLELLGDQLIDLLDGGNYLDFFNAIDGDEELMEIFFYDLFMGTVDAVFKGKLYHEKKIVQTADIIFAKLVELTTKLLKNHENGENFFVLRLLGNLLDRRMEYYRNTGRESLSGYPFGEMLRTENAKKVWVEESLQPGMRIDCIRGTNGKKIWTRGVYLGGSNSSFTRVRYESDGNENYLSNRYNDLAPLGSQTQDFEWRNSIKEGDYVDVLTMSKVWVLGRVKEAKKKKVFILYKQDHNKGGLFGAGHTLKDPLKEGEGLTEDEAEKKKPVYEDNKDGFWNDQTTLVIMRKNDKLEDTVEMEVNPHTSTMAQPGRYSERTSSTDDSEDKFYSPLDPSKIAIMRVFSTYSTSSVYFIKYINIFGTCGGLGKLFSFLNKKDLNQEILMQYTKILRSLTDFLVEDVIKSHGTLLLKKLVTYALNCTERHLRDTSQDQLQTLLDSIEGLSLRLMSKKRSERVLNLILLKVFFICVESEILDKQNFAMKIFNKIERNIVVMENSDTYKSSLHNFGLSEAEEALEAKRKQDELTFINSSIEIFKANQTLENELVEICDMKLDSSSGTPNLSKEIIASLLEKHNILARIAKGHGSLISKSTTIMKLLFSMKKISLESVAELWDLINKAEVDTRTNLLTLLKDSSWQMGMEYINCFIQYVSEYMKTSDLPMDFLEFVIEIRRVASNKHSDVDSIQVVNDILWELINKEGVDREVFKKSLEWLIRFTVNDDDLDLTEKLFQKALHNLEVRENVFISIKVISKILHVSSNSQETKMEQYYISQIVSRKIHLNLVALIKDIKQTLEAGQEFKIQGVAVSSKDEKYYKLLKKILKFLGKIIQDQEMDELIVKEMIFGLWLVFFESQSNQFRESDQINKFVKSFLNKKLQDLDPEVVSEFLRENISKMENCVWKEFFELFKMMIMFVNCKNGNVEKDEVVLDGGYFNDYNTKKLEFYVIKVPSEELNFFPELESLFLSSRNSHLESFLCSFICSLVTKPLHASSETDILYQQEENKLVQRSLKLLDASSENSLDFNYDAIPQSLVSKIKHLQLLNRCMGLGEPFGSGALLSFASLREGVPLMLNFEKENTYSTKTTSKFFFNNWAKLAKDFSLRVECVGLKRKKTGREMGRHLNNQTIMQLQIENTEQFEFFEIEMPETPEEKLINYVNQSNCEFTEKATAVFAEVFAMFSTDGLMSKKQIAEFTCKATDYNMCSENDERVRSFQKEYDVNGDGFIELPQFLEFYLNAAINKKSTVFDNLKSLGYGKDLKLKAEHSSSENFNYKESMRYKLIVNGDQYVKTILKSFEQMSYNCTEMVREMRSEDTEQEKKDHIKKNIKLMIRWSNVLKKFVYTMPPSLSIMEDILFKGMKNFESLETQGQTGFYKLMVLFGILFKSESMKKILQVVSEGKAGSAQTSNDTLPQDPKAPGNASKDPWDASMSSSKLTPTQTLDSMDDYEEGGTLLQRMATTLNLEQSVQDMFTKFSNKFFENDFFSFLSENIQKSFELSQIEIMLVKLLERGLLIPRCQDDLDQAKMLGMLIHYNRTKKKLQKQSSKESTTQTEEKAGAKTKEETNKDKAKKTFSSTFNKNTVEEFNLCSLGASIKWGNFEHSESKMNRAALSKNLIRTLNRLIEAKGLEKKMERSMTISGLVALLCLLTPLKKDITQEGREFWVQTRETCIDALLQDEDSQFKSFVIKGLMNSHIAIVRFCFRNFYSFLLDNLTSLNHKSMFLKLLIKTILSNQEEDVHLLIELAGNLFSEIMELKKKDVNQKSIDINFNELFWKFFDKFEKHESREKKFGDSVDFTLVSSLSFMEKILKTDPEILISMNPEKKKNLVLNLLQFCLFKVNSETIEYDQLKCKTTASREAALNLLACLSKNDIKSSILIFLKGLTALADHIPIPPTTSRSYTLMLEFEKKSSLGFLGIKNLGCICYMISMLQQFFCTETFTRGILMANDHVDVKMTEVKGRKVDDNVFHQFQTMVGFMQNSHRREYNPFDFCLSYKDYGGQPVNISVQQDAQEFLNCIFDRLEFSLKKTPFKGILDSVYSGTKINLIECKGCGYVRTNDEIFYNLTLDIKGLKNMEQSFKKFIEPETISDFLCDNCKKKCDISKRSSLKTVPNVLIVHLKKMIFDLDFMANIKIGTRYEFPKKLNLKDYIIKDSELNPKMGEDEDEGEDSREVAEAKEVVADLELKDEDFEYKLVGVVIHKGTSEWGHYVSLIDANRGKGDEKWLLFDDGHVSEFKMENFDEECFGASSTGNREEYGHSLYEVADTFAGASKSAYILVYDKVKKSKLHFEFSEENIQEKDFIINNLIDKENYKFENNILETGFYNLGKYTPPTIKKTIEQDNKRFILEQQLFSSSFLGFFADLIVNAGLPVLMVDFLDGYYNMAPDPYDKVGYKTDTQGNIPILPKMTPHQSVLVEIFSKVLPKYYFSLYCNSNEMYKLQAVEKLMERVFILKPTRAWEFFRFYIKENINKIFYLIISNTETIIKTSVAEITATCLQVVTKCFNMNLLKEDSQMNEPELMVKEMMEKYLSIMNHMENSNHYKKLPQYFFMLYRALIKNYRLQDFLIERQFLNDLYEFYMSKVETKTYSKDAHERALNYLLGCLSLLFKRLKQKYFSDPKNGKFYRNLFVNLLDSAFFKKLLKEDYYFSNYDFVRQLVFLACEDSELLSVKVIGVCLEGLQSSGTNDILSYMESIKSLLCIRDKISLLRIKCIFGVGQLEEMKQKTAEQAEYVFGLSKENNLEKSVCSFMSPLLKQKSLTQMIIDKQENFREWVTVVLCNIVSVVYNNDPVLLYLLKLPSPHYYSGNCLDWIWKFAKEVDKGNNITYSIMRQEIQYFYLRNFKDKINDFIVFVRQSLGISQTPEIVLFEEDWEVDCSMYISNGKKFEIAEGQDVRNINSPVLKPMRLVFDKFLERISEERKKEIKKLYLAPVETAPQEQPQLAPKYSELDKEVKAIKSDHEESDDSIKIPKAPPLKKTDPLASEATPVLSNEAKRERLEQFSRVLFSFTQSNMIGKSLSCKNVKKTQLYSISETRMNKEYIEENVISSLELRVDVQKVLTRPSLPLGSKGNLNIPQNCVHNRHYLKGNSTMKDKAFCLFVRDGVETRDGGVADDELKPYFHDVDEVKHTGKQDFSGVGNDYKVSEEGVVGEGARDEHQNKDNKSSDKPGSVKDPKSSSDKLSKDKPHASCDNQVESIIRIAISNRTEQNFMVKFEFNKIEDIDFTKQILDRGYYESDNRAELIWSDNDAYSEDETHDDEVYQKRVRKNHRSLGCKIFRKQKDVKRIKETLKKNYVVSDSLKGVSVRKKDMPIAYIRKRVEGLPFGDLVLKVSWVKIDKIGFKSLERNIGTEWDWKLLRLRLTE